MATAKKAAAKAAPATPASINAPSAPLRLTPFKKRA